HPVIVGKLFAPHGPFQFECSLRHRWSSYALLMQRSTGKHQRLDRDGNDFGDSHGCTDVNIVEIPYFNAINGDDLAVQLEFLFQDTAERFGNIDVQRQVQRTRLAIRTSADGRDSLRYLSDRFIVQWPVKRQG